MADLNVNVSDSVTVAEDRDGRLLGWRGKEMLRTTSPIVLMEVDWSSGTRRYAQTWVHLGKQWKGKILSLPNISSGVGDIKRTFQRGKITVLMDDTDYEFRSLVETEDPGFKNQQVRIYTALPEADYAMELQYTGLLYDWRFPDDLVFELSIEERSYNLENKYPDKTVGRSDYANAHDTCLGATIPVPYGTISASGLSNDGAFGWPALANSTGLAFIDTTTNSEKHLVGRQAAAITVDAVFIDGVEKTVTTHYTVSSSVVDGQTHTVINWVSGVNPTEANLVTADITFGSRGPVEAIYHFLTNFCGYAASDFNTSNYSAALTTEGDRGYTLSGALTEEKTLKTILDDWRDEFELDIYWNRSGEICWNYLSAIYSDPTEYNDLLHFLDGFDRDPQVTKIINKLDYGYNFHYGKTYYYDQDTFQDTDSQTKHGGTFRDFKGFRWIRSSSEAVDIASRKIIRFKDPITFERYNLPLPAFPLELTSMIKATHFGGVGSSGHSDRLFQIRAERYNLNRFIKELHVEDADNFSGAACFLGDEGSEAANWGAASDADKEYFYACDRDTGEFSGGDAGKRLLD